MYMCFKRFAHITTRIQYNIQLKFNPTLKQFTRSTIQYEQNQKLPRLDSQFHNECE